MKPSTIAIDGPAASGKSTIGHHLAEWLDYLYLDTGVLYRAVTWAALECGIPVDDEARINALAETLPIDVVPPTVDDGRQYTVKVGGDDVTWAIRTPAVDQNVSIVAAYPAVRTALTARMREIGARGDVVMVGRDIGTVVLPDADLKIYVEASVEVRAHRRLLERRAQGEDVTQEQMVEELRLRDAIDSGRETAPLRAAPDAVRFDNTHLTKEEMYRAVETLVLDHSPNGDP
ncbi:MAG: (d)CMP kinase [Anaerolineae bacterium]